MNSNIQHLLLNHNEIGHSGAKALAESLVVNSTLQQLDLVNNQLGNEGAIAFAECLEKNNSLNHLNLSFNQIGNKGAIAFSHMLFKTKTLEYLYLDYNTFNYNGKIALLDAVRQNSTLKDPIFSIGNETTIYEDVNVITRWNVRCDSGEHDHENFPFSYRDHILYILMILHQLPISLYLHWKIINMLRVKDVVTMSSHYWF